MSTIATDQVRRDSKRFSLRLALTILVGFLLVDAYFVATSYQNHVDTAEEGVINRLQAITNTAAIQIDGDLHKDLTQRLLVKDAVKKNEDDEAYLSLQQKLALIKETNHLATNIYTMFPKDDVEGEGQHTFYYGVTAMDPCFRHSFNTPPQILLDKYLTGAGIPQYTTENGQWISAFSPIKDSEGNVVAIVQADEDFTAFITAAKAALLKNILISVLVVSLMGFGLFMLIQKWVKMGMRRQEHENWLKGGQAGLNVILSGDKDVEELSNEMLAFLADYVKADIGAAFIAGSEDHFDLVATYAYSVVEKENSRFKSGEGLCGQAVKSRKPSILDPAPTGYIKVTSALGDKQPSAIAIYPLLNDEEVVGVIELAFVDGISDQAKEFIEMVETNIAVALKTVITANEVKDLLVVSTKQAEELRTQQESLKEANEEMEAQQEELRQANEELQEQTNLLQQSEEELRTQQEELQQINTELGTKAKQLEEKNLSIIEQNSEMEIAQRELERKAQELETASRYKSEFLANMSHELRTPLNSILLLSKLMGENKKQNLSDEQIEFATIIHKSGSGLLDLINEILDLSKIEAGKMDVDAEMILTEEVRMDMDALFRVLAVDKGLEFETVFEPSVPREMHSDRLRIDQVLKNLLSNAFKFTDKGGKVTMRAFRADMSNSENEALRGRTDMISFSVTDTGIGIAADKLGAVFEAFQQADGSTKRMYGGTGLGLSISKQIAGMLGGEMTLTSEVGVGSVFTLTIPEKHVDIAMDEDGNPSSSELQVQHAVPAAAQVAAAPSPIPAPTPYTAPTPEPVLKSETPSAEPVIPHAAPTYAETEVKLVINEIPDDRSSIEQGDKVMLIVEDDPTFARLLLDFSRERGYKGIVALQGDRALQVAKQYRPTAILMDNMLPVMDGMSVMDKLKEDAELRHIPVHFMSAIDMKKQSMKNGAIGYLMKPVSKEGVMAAMDKIEAIVNNTVHSVMILGNPTMQETISEFMNGDDMTFHRATNDWEAFNIIGENKVDCVVIDLESTGSEMFEFLDRVSKDENFGKIPLVLYASRELQPQEIQKLEFYDQAILIRTAESFAKMMDDTNLFLHRLEQKASHPEPEQVGVPMTAAGSGLAGKRVLVVDDDVRNIFALSKLLESEDMEVHTANDGFEALEALNSDHSLDIILMDIMMPGMDGYEAMEKARKINGYNRTPMIAVTAKAMAGDREKCLEAGASDYISKPVDGDQLLSMLKVWLHNEH